MLLGKKKKKKGRKGIIKVGWSLAFGVVGYLSIK